MLERVWVSFKIVIFLFEGKFCEDLTRATVHSPLALGPECASLGLTVDFVRQSLQRPSVAYTNVIWATHFKPRPYSWKIRKSVSSTHPNSHHLLNVPTMCQALSKCWEYGSMVSSGADLMDKNLWPWTSQFTM